VYGDQLAARTLQHQHEAHTVPEVLSESDFAADIKAVGVERRHEFANQLFLLQQLGPLIASLGDVLRTPEVKVDVAHIVFLLQQFGALEGYLGVVGTDLSNQRVVVDVSLPIALLVLDTFAEQTGVNHWGPAHVSRVPAHQSPLRYETLVHHWGRCKEGILQSLGEVVY